MGAKLKIAFLSVLLSCENAFVLDLCQFVFFSFIADMGYTVLTSSFTTTWNYRLRRQYLRLLCLTLTATKVCTQYYLIPMLIQSSLGMRLVYLMCVCYF